MSRKKNFDEQRSIECKNRCGVYTDVRVYSQANLEKLQNENEIFVCGFCAFKEITELKKQLDAVQNANANKKPSYANVVNSSSPATLLKTIQNEERNQSLRETNVIITNPPQVESGKYNTESVSKLLSDIGCQVTPAEVQEKEVQRRDSIEKRKILIVKFHDCKTKWSVLKNAHKLRSLPAYKETFINPDLTPEQRKQDFQLRQQLRECRASDPSNKYKINKGKVVRVANSSATSTATAI